MSENERDRELLDLQQQVLAQEVESRGHLRESFEAFERVIAQKVRQLRTERGWSQEDLAQRMTQLGMAMHQTTVAKLEGARRPIRASEVYALASAFGLPLQALWYVPVPGEPETLASMRKRLEDLDSMIAGTEKNLHSITSVYAEFQTQRMQLAQAMNEAAKAARTDRELDRNLAEADKALWLDRERREHGGEHQEAP